MTAPHNKKKKRGGTEQPKSPAEKIAALSVQSLVPKTINQSRALATYRSGKNLVVHGLAGTGKTFLACGLGLEDVAARRTERVVIYRSVVPSRDVGFLPGTLAEKASVYEEPYKAVVGELVARRDGYEMLKRLGLVEFSTTSFLRGLTLRDSTVIVEEAQNMTLHELDSLITRLGDGSRMIVCGDYRQTDLVGRDDRSGMAAFTAVLETMSSFAFVEMGRDDVVRSALVREYILAKDALGLS